jgi:predicted nucleic acid-binding protein
MKNVFIDTNILLKVYSYSDDSPTRLKEILELIEKKDIKLIITEQIFNEFYRNRELKLAPSLDSIKNLRNSPFKIPAFCQDISEIKEIKKYFDKIEDASKNLYPKLLAEIGEKSLEVDKLFNQIFSKAGIIELSKEVLEEAKERFDLGNPPGKDGSYGDAINWIILLKDEVTPKKEDLYFIGEDKDFLTKDKENFSGFLKDEWEKMKSSKIIWFKSISKFLKETFNKKDITEDQIRKEEKTPSVIKSYLSYDTLVRPFEEVVTGSAFFPNWTNFSGLSNSFNPQSANEEEKKCERCNRVFYHPKHSIIKQCPYCKYSYI